MALRLGPGTVFWVELVAAGRRWQTYAMRTALVALLLVAMLFVCAANTNLKLFSASNSVSLNEYSQLGSNFAMAILFAQLTFVLLAAPAATAGAICIDRSRGNLELLLATDLRAREIVADKLFARLMPIISLFAASIPVLFLTTLLGGVSAQTVLDGFAIIAVTAVMGCTIGLTASLYVSRLHEALLLTYLIEAGWLAADWLNLTHRQWNPYTVLLEATGIYTLPPDNFALFTVGTLCLSAILVLLVASRLRRIVLRTAGRRTGGGTRGRRHLYVLNRNPLLWYEWHRKRPTRASRLINLLFALAMIGSSIWAACLLWEPSVFRFNHFAAVGIIDIQICVSILLLITFAVASISDFTAQKQPDVLLATPLTTRAIVWAKWLSVARLIPKWLLLPLVLLFIASVADVREYRSPNSIWWISQVERRLAAYFIEFTLHAAHLFACTLMLVSFGLFAAVWMGKFAHAIGVTIGVSIWIFAIWPLLIYSAHAEHQNLFTLVLAASSPISVQEMVSADTFWSNWVFNLNDQTENAEVLYWTGVMGWTLFYAAASIALFFMTVHSFNVRIRRVPETGLARKKLPPWERAGPSRREKLLSQLP
ncbi:MAG: hypothetical protein ACJ8C4_20290 [Gemmataceae bacterium]